MKEAGHRTGLFFSTGRSVMRNDEDEAPVLTKTEARQGVQVRPQLWALVGGLILAAVALAALMAWGPGSDVNVPAGGEVPNTSQQGTQQPQQ
jgi:hypothetical protein